MVELGVPALWHHATGLFHRPNDKDRQGRRNERTLRCKNQIQGRSFFPKTNQRLIIARLNQSGLCVQCSLIGTQIWVSGCSPRQKPWPCQYSSSKHTKRVRSNRIFKQFHNRRGNANWGWLQICTVPHAEAAALVPRAKRYLPRYGPTGSEEFFVSKTQI